MFLVAFKLVVTPLLVAAASLTGRRWGPGVSGWLVAFPLVSGPVSIIFATQNGTTFAAQAAVGTTAGLVSVSAYCFVYCRLARSNHWLVCLIPSALAFFAVTALINSFTLPLVPVFIVSIAILFFTVRSIPEPQAMSAQTSPPRWDIAARMVTAAVFIVALTFAADHLGPQLSGSLSPFPILATILAVFAHIHDGSNAAIHVMRGILTGLGAFGAFFLIVGSLITITPLVITYSVGILAALSVNAFLLRYVRGSINPEAVLE